MLTESPFLPRVSLEKFFAYYPTGNSNRALSPQLEKLVNGESAVLNEMIDCHAELEQLLSDRLKSSWFKEEARAVVSPFPFAPLYLSERFKEIIGKDDEALRKFMQTSKDSLYIFACGVILERHFGYPLTLKSPFQLSFSESNGLTSQYRVDLIADLTDLEPGENAHMITEEEYYHLMDNFEDVELWKRYFPPASWLVTGVCVVQLIDRKLWRYHPLDLLVPGWRSRSLAPAIVPGL